MLIALITDTHFGVRSESPELLAHMTSFYANQFFPYLRKHGIKTVCHLGDIVDRRKFIQYPILASLKEVFMRPIWEMGIDLHIVVGNHDTYYRNTNSLHAMKTIFGRFDGGWEPKYYEFPEVVTFGDCDILMLPWITSENEAESMAMLQSTNAEILFGHVELNGFEMYKGLPNFGGLDRAIFKNFHTVMSGHFHHKSDVDNIHYLGSPYEMTWADFDDPRGFHVFDTDTRELTYIRNTERMFYKLFYADVDKTSDELLSTDFSAFSGKYVKVVVQQKSNPHTFDIFMTRLHDVGCADISIVEDHYNAQHIDEADLIDQAEDTLVILSKYVSDLKGTVDRPAVEATLISLYHESMNMEDSTE
mgnify:CR=1 FL=1